MIRNSIKRLLGSPPVIAVLRFGFGLFFDKKYLRGRWFDDSLAGWLWAAKALVVQKLLGRNRRASWPISAPVIIGSPQRVHFHREDLNNFNGCFVYFQVIDAEIFFGKGVYIAPNVGFITTNHDSSNPKRHMPGQNIEIGDGCWIGMNAVILPGVVLGGGTVVGAGAVVTKDIPEYAIAVGNPARIINYRK